VTQVVADYGFDGIDLDFETPSLNIDPGDTDFRHPTTPSIVNVIWALRQLHDHFGPGFMISLVPEGSQGPAGYTSYGGQFGSYLAITYAIRDILSFIDAQDYNTPPLEGLDGEIYQSSSVDYHAAITELLLHGFNVGGDTKQSFPPLPASKIAVGFLTGYTSPNIVSQAMDYIISGKAPVGTRYKAWYHVGRLTQYGQSVSWGKSHPVEVAGRSPRDKQVFPSVALTNDNYVIVEYSDAIDKVGSELRYRVGRISPSGSVDQDIEWLTADTIYDTGYDSSLSVNAKGVIVEVHESDGKTGIFYRIGHLEDPSAGKYSIVWDSGDLGIQYDNGVIPHISINNQNQVVEMHQINSKESIVHYRRGTLQFKSGSPARIAFEASQRYRENAREPAVLLTDRDSVVALYQNGNIFWETGVYHTYNPAYIWWQGNVKMRDNALGRYPGIGSNDVYMIATWHLDGKLYYATAFVP
jgi:hypothetical protein